MWFPSRGFPRPQKYVQKKLAPLMRHHPPIRKPKPSRWGFDTGPLKLFLLVALLLIVITILELALR